MIPMNVKSVNARMDVIINHIMIHTDCTFLSTSEKTQKDDPKVEDCAQ